MVTNAVRHSGGGTILITVTLTDGQLRAEVRDESANLPTPRTAGESGGWGLELIERLSDRWGVSPHHGDGKTVWFEIHDAEPTDRPSA